MLSMNAKAFSIDALLSRQHERSSPSPNGQRETSSPETDRSISPDIGDMPPGKNSARFQGLEGSLT